MNENLYHILKIKKTASPEEIKKAYYKMAKKLHPDKDGDNEQMALVNKAYETLSDQEKRKYYDETGETELKDFDKQILVYIRDCMYAIFADENNRVDNFVISLKNKTYANIEELKGFNKTWKKSLEVLELKLRKIKHNKKDKNIIGIILNDEIELAKQSMNKNIIQMEFLKKVHEHLCNYQYE